MAVRKPAQFLSRAKSELGPIICYMEAYTLKTALDYIGCQSLDEFALSCGLDAVDLHDPADRALIERMLHAQVIHCREWFAEESASPWRSAGARSQCSNLPRYSRKSRESISLS